MPTKPRPARERGSLQKYVEKREFTQTPEPQGAVASSAKRLRFVIQKHRATRLHYDFRLEADGVLKSWAVPKGPSLALGDRRLAMHVEDHPLDYRDFEGIIPKGNYGAGEVIVWDSGTYKLAEGIDPADEIGKGKIKFILSGKKMRGEFTLVKIRGRDADGDPWLLIKDKDEYVNPAYDIEKDNKSIKSGRTLVELSKESNAPRWISNRPAAANGAKPAAPKKKASSDKLPTIVTPMLATLVERPFDNQNWLFEIKWDGYRAICIVREDGTVSLTSRNGLDFLQQFGELADIASAFTSLPIIVDGEIVSLDAQGRSSFQRLQGSFDQNRPGRRAAEQKRYPLTFVAFDVLYADGKDVRQTPLEERKRLLENLLAPHDAVMYSKHVVQSGIALYEQAQRQHLEGIVGKKRDSQYVQRRSRDWVKIKAQLVQECVIGGYTEPRGSRKGFGALLLGLYDDTGQLQYAGHVGTGFDEKKLSSIYKQLQDLHLDTSPFAQRIKTNTRSHWVKPSLVAQVRFTEWTRDGSMRHPAFLGLRSDKDPSSCVREVAADTGEIA